MTSNGWRALLWYRLILWRVMPGYIIGSGLAFAILTWISFQPPTAWVYIGMGIVPMIAVAVPAHIAPDIRRPYASTILGFLVMSVQLLSGVAGVLVDIFFFRTDLDRRQIVATKAFSQLVGHVYRLIYFTLIATHSEVSAEVPLWVFGVSIVTAILGATLARVVLERLTNRAFLMWTRGLGVAVGAVYLIHGIYLLL